MNISRVIKHPQSYMGEGYKDYGGYDIALVEIDGNTTVDNVACLPSPKYFDTRLSNVAGYSTDHTSTTTVASSVQVLIFAMIPLLLRIPPARHFLKMLLVLIQSLITLMRSILFKETLACTATARSRGKMTLKDGVRLQAVFMI